MEIKSKLPRVQHAEADNSLSAADIPTSTRVLLRLQIKIRGWFGFTVNHFVLKGGLP